MNGAAEVVSVPYGHRGRRRRQWPGVFRPIPWGAALEGDMSGLPLRFKDQGLVERYQMEGMDPSDRSFNRTVFVNRMPAGYVGKTTYEAFVVEGVAQSTTEAAVRSVAERLLAYGFTRLRSRLNFKGTRYLAEKETWVDYPDLLTSFPHT